MTAELATVTSIDEVAVLRALGIDGQSPAGQAALLVCKRYGLDPLMKHLVLISQKPYVTRDGYLHVAHRSGVLDGIEVVETGIDATHYWAKVSVFRKDMGRPFTYVGRYPKTGQQKAYGPEMAIKTGEVAALRRAFDVSGFAAVDEAWDDPEVDTRLEPSRPTLSGMNVFAFLAKCSEAGCTAEDIDGIVAYATKDRTTDPNAVHIDEIAALRAALDWWRTEPDPPKEAA